MATLSLAPPQPAAHSPALQLPDLTSTTLFPPLGPTPPSTLSSSPSSPSSSSAAASSFMAPHPPASHAHRGPSPVRHQGPPSSFAPPPAAHSPRTGSPTVTTINTNNTRAPHPSNRVPPPAMHHSPSGSFHSQYPQPGPLAPYAPYPHHPHPHHHHSQQSASPVVPFPSYVQHSTFGPTSYTTQFAGPPPPAFLPPGTQPPPHMVMQAYQHHQQMHVQMLPMHQNEYGRQSPGQAPGQIVSHRPRTPSSSSQNQQQLQQRHFPHAFPPGQNPYAAPYQQGQYVVNGGAPYPYGYHRPHIGPRGSGSESPQAPIAPQPVYANAGSHPMYMQPTPMRGSSHSLNSQNTGRQSPMALRVRTDSGESGKKSFSPLSASTSRPRTESQTSARSANGRSSTSGSLSGSGPNSPLTSNGTLGLAAPLPNSMSGRKSSPLSQQTFTGSARKGLVRDPLSTDDDDASSSDAGKQGHRSTPGTSVDSTASANLTYKSPLGNGSPVENDRAVATNMLQKQNKKSLSNKLRKALSMGALHEAATEQAQHGDPVKNVDDNKSQIGSVMGGRSVTPSMSSGRRLFNLRGNGSTDNLSISSTVSSASVMIRKIGTLGKAAKRNSVLGLTKMFKDGKVGDSTLRPPVGVGKASTSVHQITAEIDREAATTELKGLSPAAALVHQQKQQYAEQEALAASSGFRSPVFDARGPAWSTRSKTTDDAIVDAKRRAIEQEKERLKSRKGRKWGFGGSSFSGGSEGTYAAAVVAEEEHRLVALQGGKSNDAVEHTIQPSEVRVDVPSPSGDETICFEGQDGEDETSPQTQQHDLFEGEFLDDYDTPSLRGFGPQQLKPRPSREATPAKGILKNAKNFIQEDALKQVFDVSASQPRIEGHESQEEIQTTPSPSLVVISPSPYAQPSANTSLPTIINVTSSPISSLPARSLTSPPVGVGGRRATFAQNLSVHSTWPPALYDRRGEPATCNRLTPALAQRIKEELNAFKMEEMLVHQTSRVHTHFMR